MGYALPALGDPLLGERLVRSWHDVRERRRGATELGAERLVVAPVAELAASRPKLAQLRRLLDRLPQRDELALDPEQVGLVGGVAQDRPIAQVHELKQLRDLAGRAPEDQRVELHLEQRLALERLPRRLPGVVRGNEGLAAEVQGIGRVDL